MPELKPFNSIYICFLNRGCVESTKGEKLCDGRAYGQAPLREREKWRNTREKREEKEVGLCRKENTNKQEKG